MSVFIRKTLGPRLLFGRVASISSIVLADGGLRQLCKDLCAAVVCAKEDLLVDLNSEFPVDFQSTLYEVHCVIGEFLMSSEVTLEVVAVDDSPSVLAQFKQLVSGINGVKVVGTAKDGLEAIALLRDTKADLVVMDIVMPRMDGLTALRTLRVSNPGIRVAMLSSVAGSRSRAEEAFRLGAVQVLTKPVDPVKLRELLAAERAAKASAGG